MERTTVSIDLTPDSSDSVLDVEVSPIEFAKAARSPATQKAYDHALKAFGAWCKSKNVEPYPTSAEVLALYLSHLACLGRAVSTIKKAKSAIDARHRAGDLPAPGADPRVKLVMRGITRQVGAAPKTRKSPLLTANIQEMLKRIPDNLKGIRDRALLLTTFSGAFRKSEVISLGVGDIDLEDEGVKVHLRRSKTDQTGAGSIVGLARGSRRSTCPVTAVEAWLAASKVTDGPVFRQVTRHGHVGLKPLSPSGFSKIIKEMVEAAGLDLNSYSPHSLRAGFATQAAMLGVEERIIAKQTRHRSMEVLRSYIREGELFRDNASSQLGL